LNTTENDGAKFDTPVLGVVYVVPLSLPKLSAPFMQYSTSHTFWKNIRLSLVMRAAVAIFVATHACVMLTSLLPLAAVTTPLPVSASIKSMPHAHDMSVPTHAALATVIADDDVVSTDDITKWFVSQTTVSVLPVRALIPVWIIVATFAIVTADAKFNHVTDLSTQSIVMLKEPSVTAFHVATTLVAPVSHVRYAGVYSWLCLTINLSLAESALRYEPIPLGYDHAVSCTNIWCHGLIIIDCQSSLQLRLYGE